MTNFTYNDAVPDPNNDPSDDVTPMGANAVVLGTIWDVDHVGFNAANGGTHNKVTLLDQLATPTSAASQAVAFSQTTSSITMPYYVRDNKPTVFPLSPIKAFARINAAGTVISSWNITGNAVKTGTASNPVYTFTITEGMRTTNYGVITTPSQPLLDQFISFGYNVLSTTSFVITFASTNAAHVPSDITVMLLEF